MNPTLACLAFATLVSLGACSSASHGASSKPADAGAADAADADGGLPCTAAGVSKGPWTLHVDGSSVVVRWEACRAGTAPGLSYAPETGGASTHAVATETPFVVTSTYRGLGSIPPDYAGTWYMHEATLSGLAPSTCYAYGLDADASIKARFCTARQPADSVRFLSIGDTNPGLGGSTTHLLSHVVPMGFDFVVHGGDIEYDASLVETYALWFQLMAPLLRAGPFLPAVGNHDGDSQTGEPTDKFQQYTDRFWGGAGFGGTDLYYEYSSGGIFFFTLDTDLPMDPSSAQYQWLVAGLQAAAAQPGYRFSILNVHRPFLTCGDTGDDTTDLAQLQPIFTQYKLLLVLQAHMHGYERFTTPGLTLVTSAGGGALIGNVDANTSRAYCSERVASGGFFNATLFEVTPGMLSATVVDDQGAVRDQYQLVVP